MKKYVPVILFLASLIPVLISLNYRENDYMTGAYLLIYVFLPAIVVEVLLLTAYYLSENIVLKRIVIAAEAIIFSSLALFTVIYIFNYN